ncbi:hypothetical protein D3C81_1855640 [compost metagenome]
MNMMEADVPCHPLQNSRQLIIGTAVYRGAHVIPVVRMLVIRTLELMLHVEKPDARNAGQIENRPLNQKDLLPAQRPAEQPHQTDHHRIGEIRVQALLAFGAFPIHPVTYHKQKNRAKSEHNKWVAI